MELPQHYNIDTKITYIRVWKTYNISLQNMFKKNLTLDPNGEQNSGSN
jgi:hypothetical protein